MNILYLTTHLNIGGVSSYLLALATGLKAKGHNIIIASCGGALVSRFKEEGINHFYIPIRTKSEIDPKVLLSALVLLKQIKEKNIDIIHAHTRVTQILSYLLSCVSGRPFVTTCHGFFKRRFSRRIFPCWGKRVIAISEQVKEHLIRDFKVNENNIVVINNGIDVDKFREQPAPAGYTGGPGRTARPGWIYRRAGENSPPRPYSPAGRGEQRKKDLGLGEGPVVGIVARLSDVKGHIYLIEAMRFALEKIPQAQLLIVGDGRMKNDLLKRVDNLGIKDSVFFVPSVLDTREVLSVMDVFVMPSLKEGLGLALMEAMASGLAVIASRIGGINSLIKDGISGRLVEPADSQAIAAAILELLQDPAKRNYLGANAQGFIENNFSQAQMVSETEELYLECLSARD